MRTDEIKRKAEEIANAVAQNTGCAPQLCFPHVYLGLRRMFESAASQVAPQATVENMRAIIEDALAGFTCAQDVSRYPEGHWSQRAVALLATPPASKALCNHEWGKKTPGEPWHVCRRCGVDYSDLDDALTGHADTPEAIRNAALEEAIKACEKVEAGQKSLSDMYVDADGYTTEMGIPFSNKALGANHCVVAIRALESATPSASKEEPKWRCFHCEGTFDNRDDAAKHFGPSERYDPACQIDIEKYREMQDKVARHCEEDTDLHRQIYGLQNDIVTARKRDEEEGYARGLRDAAKYPDDIIKAAPTQEQLRCMLSRWVALGKTDHMARWLVAETEALLNGLPNPEKPFDAAAAASPQAGEVKPDFLGRALDLESLAKTVQSQTVQRAMEAGAHCLRLALDAPAGLGEPVAWISYDTLTGKERIDRKPIQSIQPGVYKHTPLYDAPALQAMPADAKDLENLLRELMACSSADPGRKKSHAGRWTTVNVRTELISRIDAAIAAMQVKP